MKKTYQELIDNPEQLAYKLLDKGEINPFKLAKKLNINIYLMGLSHNLYSFYTKGENGITSIILNGSIPVQRQRYNVALQIYFHLTNANNIAYYKDFQKSELLDKAKTFAACYLLPEDKLKETMKPYLKNGKIDYKDIIYVANELGVSFKTTAFRIFYKFNNINNINTVEDLRKEIGTHITYRDERKNKVPDYQITDLKYLQQMIDYISLLPVEQMESIMKTKLVRDVIYGDIKTAEQMDLNINSINKIIAGYQKNGCVKMPVGRHSEKTLLLQELVEGQLDAYKFIFSDLSKVYATPENAKYILIHLHSLLFGKVTYGSSDYQAGEMVDENTPDRTVNFLFEIPRGYRIEKEKEKVEMALENLLKDKDKLTNSEYINRAIEVFFLTYTSQLFNDGNSRVSKTLLNYLLHLKGIPSSFSVADSIRDEYLKAIALLGYDHRVQKGQEQNDYNMRVKNKEGKIGEYHFNNFGYEWVNYPNEEERQYDPEIDTIEYEVTKLFVPNYLKDILEEKSQKTGWETYREIDYKPLQAIIYKGIISTYIDCMKMPSPDKNIEPTKKPN